MFLHYEATRLMPIRSYSGSGSQPSHVLTNMVGVYLAVDDAFCDLLKRGRGELIGQRVVTFTRPDEQAQHERSLKCMQETGAPISALKTYLRSDGELVRVGVAASIITNGFGSRSISVSVQPLPVTTPITQIESDFIAAGRILSARRTRTLMFDTQRFSGMKWDIALTCYRFECATEYVTVTNVCEACGVDIPHGSLAILEMVANGDLEIEHAGVGIEDTAIRVTASLQLELTSYLAECSMSFGRV